MPVQHVDHTVRTLVFTSSTGIYRHKNSLVLGTINVACRTALIIERLVILVTVKSGALKVLKVLRLTVHGPVDICIYLQFLCNKVVQLQPVPVCIRERGIQLELRANIERP